MKNEIREHYREDDIQRMKLHSDIDNWNAEIDFMKKETVFFLALLKLPSFKDRKNTDHIIRDLKKMEEQNENYSVAILNFSNTLEGLNECEDLQCETYFLNSHEELRGKLTKHGLDFRALKEQIFSFLI